jgi:hypothetical protein
MDAHTLMTPTSALIHAYLEPCAFETPNLDVSTDAKSEDNPFDKAFKKGLAERTVNDPFAHSFGHALKQKYIGEAVKSPSPPSRVPELYTHRPSSSHPLSISELKELYMTSEAVALDSPTGTTIPQPQTHSDSDTHCHLAADFDIENLPASSSSSVSSTESYQATPPRQEEQQNVTHQKQM